MDEQNLSATVQIETTAETGRSVANWFGESPRLAQPWNQQGIPPARQDQVRVGRRRFGTDEVIDFVVMLVGYASSGERTLKTYSERVEPFKTA